jgi:hypothetical protein
MEWHPHPGPQAQFIKSRAHEVLYGGAAGGGKSEALLIGALRFINYPGYRALLLRRTYPELEGKGSGLIPRSRELLSDSARYDEHRQLWTFQSGATLGFGHLEHPHSVHMYQSAQFAYIGFDELTTFLESQYVYMLSRVRSVAGVPPRVRAASNPGGIGHLWVRRRFVEPLAPGEIRWFKRATAGDAHHLRPERGAGRPVRGAGEGSGEVQTEPFTPDAMARQFIPARVYDNPTLLAKDPGYINRLKALDPVDRKRLLDGDWYVANSGTVYGTFTDDNLTEKEPDASGTIELAFDDGYVDPRAILFVQRSGTEVLIFDELYHSHHLGAVCVGEVLERCKANGWPLPEIAVGSPEAIELREVFRQHNIAARYEKSNIVEGIKAVRRLVCDDQGVRVLKVHRRCRNLLNEMQGGYQYPAGSTTHDNETPLDQDNHAVDALRYWVWMRARRQ